MDKEDILGTNLKERGGVMRFMILLSMSLLIGTISSASEIKSSHGHFKKIQSVLPKGPYNCEHRMALFREELEQEPEVTTYLSEVFMETDTQCSINVTYAVERAEYHYPSAYRTTQDCENEKPDFDREFESYYGHAPTYSACFRGSYRATLTRLTILPPSNPEKSLEIKEFRSGNQALSLSTRWEGDCKKQAPDALSFASLLYPGADIEFECVIGKISEKTGITLSYDLVLRVMGANKEKELDSSWSISIEKLTARKCMENREVIQHFYEEVLDRDVLFSYCSRTEKGESWSQDIRVVWR